MQKLPDFDAMFELAETAAAAKSEILLLENLEAATAAEFMREAILNEDYWMGGKAPTATLHLPKIVAKIGNTLTDKETMLAIQARLAGANSAYIEAIEKLRVLHAMVSMYQTESANKRITLT